MSFMTKQDQWWDSLSYEDRCNAFEAVVSRIHKGEFEENGTYRYILYNVFEFHPDMYVTGLDCGFMAIHNAIVESKEETNSWKPMKQEVE